MAASAERRGRRRGLSMPEFAVIFVILGIGVATLYGMFWTTSEEAFKTKWAYLAMHAAREELEAVRTMNLFGRRNSEPYKGHDWQMVEGSLMRGIATNELTNDEFVYPVHYSRMETKVEVEGDPASRVLTVTLYIRYQQKGADRYGFEAADGTILPIGIYQTLVVDRWFR